MNALALMALFLEKVPGLIQAGIAIKDVGMQVYDAIKTSHQNGDAPIPQSTLDSLQARMNATDAEFDAAAKPPQFNP